MYFLVIKKTFWVWPAPFSVIALVRQGLPAHKYLQFLLLFMYNLMIRLCHLHLSDYWNLSNRGATLEFRELYILKAHSAELHIAATDTCETCLNVAFSMFIYNNKSYFIWIVRWSNRHTSPIYDRQCSGTNRIRSQIPLLKPNGKEIYS